MKQFTTYVVGLFLTSALSQTATAQNNVETKSPTVLNLLPAAAPDVLRVQNGLLSHRVAGTIGSFGPSDQWIGVGAPLSSLYGERTQWNGQAFIKALRSQNPAVPSAIKDAILEWGNQGGEMQFRYVTNPTSPTGFIRIQTLTSAGNAYFGSNPPPTVSGIPKVGINANAGSPALGAFAIDATAGEFYATSSDAGTAIGVQGFIKTAGQATINYAVNGLIVTIPKASNNVGVLGEIGTNASEVGTVSSNIGVLGLVRNVSEDGFQAGVYGEIASQFVKINSTNYAVAGFATDAGVSYAGYFQGNVFATGLYLGSDSKLKQNIVAETGVMDQLRKLNPVVYDFDTEAHKGFNLPTQKQHGLIAQEVQALFPELVRTNQYITKDKEGKINPSEAYLAVNYIGLIPILIKAVQEQQLQLDAQLSEIAALKALVVAQSGNTNAEQADRVIVTKSGNVKTSQFSLLQNTPNPFSSATTIRYSLPKGVNNATIAVFDLNGKMQLQYNNLNGSSQITINGNTLLPGMYIYTLLAEGQEVVSKRMVLTK